MKFVIFVITFSLFFFSFCDSFNYNYFNTKEYLKKNKITKQDLLWNECLKIKRMYTPKNREHWFLGPKHKYLKFLFTHIGDAIPFNWKLIHIQGLIAKCKFAPSKKSVKLFTGIFKGASNGFIRISTTELFEESYQLSQLKSTPVRYRSISSGVGLKFFREKIHSANFLFTGRGEYDKIPDKDNIFKFVQDSYVGVAQLLGTKQFIESFQMNPYFFTLGFYDNAKFDQNGNKVDKPRFPYNTKLRAGKNMKKKITYGKKEYIKELQGIKSGAEIFNLYGIQNPKIGCEVFLGKIILKSKFSLSLFADKHLFLHHGHKSLDFNIYPNWIKYTGFVYKFKPFKGKNIGKCPFDFKK